MYRYLDIFAGAGGLSEGFVRAGFKPVGHIEMDRAACYTLKTRVVYQWLLEHQKLDKYQEYLNGELTREMLYKSAPKEILESVFNYEISQENLEEIFQKVEKLLEGKKLDLVLGGPPCQAYSLVGRARDKNRMRGDLRNYLYKLYAEFLKKFKPRYFVFENVTGLLSARDIDGRTYLEKMLTLFGSCGYSVEYRKLNARDYGILQNRSRVILVGKYGRSKDFFPDILSVEHSYTVNEILEDLPKIKAGEGRYESVKISEYTGKYLFDAKIKRREDDTVTFHCARPNKERDLEIYKIAVQLWNNEKRRLCYTDLPERLRSQNNMVTFLDRFKVVASDLPYSQTVVAHIAKDGHYFIHPDIEQNRSLTPREAARLQTFPDDYYFESISGRPSRTSAYKQIGNAVPVLLAEKIANALLEKW